MKTLLQAQSHNVFPNGGRTKRDFNDMIGSFGTLTLSTINLQYLYAFRPKTGQETQRANDHGKTRENRERDYRGNRGLTKRFGGKQRPSERDETSQGKFTGNDNHLHQLCCILLLLKYRETSIVFSQIQFSQIMS